MNKLSIEAAFADWWEESYGRPPGSHAVMTHVAFTEHILQLLELLEICESDV
jgi:hypothetical protein